MSPGVRGWCIRAAVAFAGVYLLGLYGVATLVPYLAVLIAVTIDLFRTLRSDKVPRKRRRT